MSGTVSYLAGEEAADSVDPAKRVEAVSLANTQNQQKQTDKDLQGLSNQAQDISQNAAGREAPQQQNTTIGPMSTGTASQAQAAQTGSSQNVKVNQGTASLANSSTAENTKISPVSIASGENMKSANVGSMNTVDPNAAKMTAAQAGPAKQATNSNMQSAQIGSMNTVDPNAAKADQVSLSPTQNMQSAQIGNASTSNAAQASNANINRQDEQFRAQQSNLANNLEQAAAGNGPSLVSGQLNQGLAASNAARMAAASSQRGYGNTASTMRQLAQDQSVQQFATAQAAGQAKLQEQLAAREQLGNALTSARGQDIGVNTSQGQLLSNENLQNAQLNQQTSLANQDAANQFKLSQAQLDQQTNKSNQDAQNTMNLEQAKLTQQTNLQNAQSIQSALQANQNALNTGKITQAQFDQEAAKLNQALEAQTSQFNTQQQNTVDLENARMAMAAAQQNAQQAQQALLANQAALNNGQITQAQFEQEAARLNQQVQAATSQFNAAQKNTQALEQAQLSQQNNQFNAGQTQQISLANAGAQNAQTQQNVGVAAAAAQQDADAANRLVMQQAELDQATALRNAELDQQMSLANMDATNTGTLKQADLNQLTGSQNQQASLAQTGLNDDLQSGMFGQSANLQQQQFENAKATDELNMQSVYGAEQLSTYYEDIRQAEMAQKRAAAEDASDPLGSILSDKRAKKVKKPSLSKAMSKDPNNEIEEFLDSAKGFTYNYKPGFGEDTKKEYFSPMAQNLEKSKIGKSIVETDENNIKRVNYGKALGSFASSMSYLNDRLENIESKLASLKGK